MQTHTAVQIFKNMKSTGYPTSDATYNIMIECCNVTACFRSASALVAMMIHDGYLPNAMTYTTLIKVSFLAGITDVQSGYKPSNFNDA